MNQTTSDINKYAIQSVSGIPTLRNTIEALNGYSKDPAHESLAAPGRHQVRGMAAQSIFVAILAMAANLRKIRAYRDKVAQEALPQPKRAKRRRVSLCDCAPTYPSRDLAGSHRDDHLVPAPLKQLQVPKNQSAPALRRCSEIILSR